MGLPEYMRFTEWEIAYWENLAKYGRRKRLWWSGWDGWALALGSDEMNRRTLVIGPLVIALWDCRCVDCKADEKRLLAILGAEVELEVERSLDALERGEVTPKSITDPRETP